MLKILKKLENFGFGGCLKLKYEVNIVQNNVNNVKSKTDLVII